MNSSAESSRFLKHISYRFCRVLASIKDYLPGLFTPVLNTLHHIRHVELTISTPFPITFKDICTGAVRVAIACLVIYSLPGLAESTTPQDIPVEHKVNNSSDSSIHSNPNYDSVLKRGLEAYRNGDYVSAVEAFKLAVSSAERTQAIAGQFDALLYLSDGYQSLGFRQQQLQTLSQANALKENLQDTARLVGLYDRLGGVYLSTGDTQRAKDLLDAGMQVARSSDQDNHLAVLWNGYGNYHVALDEYSAATTAFRNSMRLAVKEKNWSLASRAAINHTRAMLDSDEGIGKRRIYNAINESRKHTRRLSDSYNKAENYLAIGDLLRTTQIKYACIVGSC